MAFTGAMLVFEPQILTWADHDASRIVISEGASTMDLSDLILRAHSSVGKGDPSSISVINDSNTAVTVNFGKKKSVYVNPYTGEVRKGNSDRWMPFFRQMAFWHRQLGIKKGPLGFSLVKIATVLLAVLCLSGLFLWFPHKLRWRALKPIIVPCLHIKGRARYWSWHNVAGIWTLPFVIAMTWSGLVLSFHGLQRWLYTPSSPVLLVASSDSKKVSPDFCLEVAKKIIPDWESISINFSSGKKKRGVEPQSPQPSAFTVKIQEKGWWHILPVEILLNPYNGDVISVRRISDMSFGEALYRLNMSFHRGDFLGLFGQTMNFFSCWALILLVLTGYILVCKRFVFFAKNTLWGKDEKEVANG